MVRVPRVNIFLQSLVNNSDFCLHHLSVFLRELNWIIPAYDTTSWFISHREQGYRRERGILLHVLSCWVGFFVHKHPRNYRVIKEELKRRNRISRVSPIQELWQFGCVVAFPSGASGKRTCLPVQETKRRGFNPWVGKIRWRRAWQCTTLFLPQESHGQRSLMGYSPWSHKESGTAEAT